MGLKLLCTEGFLAYYADIQNIDTNAELKAFFEEAIAKWKANR
ncbi:hypothetical protein AAEO56_16010 [Flavobacterium sp. DGU11]|uniref:Uncharacterized protein n=1 Tax=Flavobacterium arundinis TaxID=3139143 RepID=A0ABU9I029_9FLAO